jgi:hypothetical protein
MGRRHDRFLDRFLWLLLGTASGALIVPVALGMEHPEKRSPPAAPTHRGRRKTDPFPSSSGWMTLGRWPQR